MNDYSPEFKSWYERHFLQSPSLCKLEYDDEKMWEAWKAAKKWQGLSEDEVDNACNDSDKDFNVSAFRQGVNWAEQNLKEKNS